MSSLLLEVYSVTAIVKIDANLDAQYRTAVAGKHDLLLHAVLLNYVKQ